MPKYLLLHNSTLTAKESMANASPEEMKASMKEWIDWKDDAEKTVKFEWGLPVQAVASVTAHGVKKSDNPAGGYSIIEADSKDAVIAVLKKHPQLKRPDASIDVLEMIPMPGM